MRDPVKEALEKIEKEQTEIKDKRDRRKAKRKEEDLRRTMATMTQEQHEAIDTWKGLRSGSGNSGSAKETGGKVGLKLRKTGKETPSQP